MMSESVCKPYYQEIDGLRLPGLFLPEAYESGLKYNPTPDDFFIVTFPKCGTTWTQQMISLIFTKGKPVADFKEFTSRTPFLEMLGTEGIDRMVRPGSIKTHLPYHLTPISPDAKYLYVARNPKDVVISFYHHTRTSTYRYQDGKFEDFFELFINGENDYGDYFDHLLGWYEHRDDPNVMFLTYEELKRDTRNMVRKIAKFMGEEYYQMLEEDEGVLNDVLKYSTVDHMKIVFNDSYNELVDKADLSSNTADGVPAGLHQVLAFTKKHQKEGDKKFNYIRKGIVGDWRSNFTEDQAKRMDARIESKLKGTDVYDYWKSINCI